jgi:hypothetical protein
LYQWADSKDWMGSLFLANQSLLLAHWYNSPQVDTSLPSDTLSLFLANQSLLLAHWYNSPQVDTSLPSDTLSLFLANQSLLLAHSYNSPQIYRSHQIHNPYSEPTSLWC